MYRPCEERTYGEAVCHPVQQSFPLKGTDVSAVRIVGSSVLKSCDMRAGSAVQVVILPQQGPTVLGEDNHAAHSIHFAESRDIMVTRLLII
jgi:hypothetical protein